MRLGSLYLSEALAGIAAFTVPMIENSPLKSKTQVCIIVLLARASEACVFHKVLVPSFSTDTLSIGHGCFPSSSATVIVPLGVQSL